MSILRYEHFLGKAVDAFSSDAQYDFLKGAGSSGAFEMTPAQKAMLSQSGIKPTVIFPKQIHTDIIWEVTTESAAATGVY